MSILFSLEQLSLFMEAQRTAPRHRYLHRWGSRWVAEWSGCEAGLCFGMWPLSTDRRWVYPSRRNRCPEATFNMLAKSECKNDGVVILAWQEIVAYAGEMGDAPTGGKSSKLLKLSCPTDGGETCSPILLYPPPPLPDLLPPFSSPWCPPRPPLPGPPVGTLPAPLLRPLCNWKLGLGWRSGGDTM